MNRPRRQCRDRAPSWSASQPSPNLTSTRSARPLSNTQPATSFPIAAQPSPRPASRSRARTQAATQAPLSSLSQQPPVQGRRILVLPLLTQDLGKMRSLFARFAPSQSTTTTVEVVSAINAMSGSIQIVFPCPQRSISLLARTMILGSVIFASPSWPTV